MKIELIDIGKRYKNEWIFKEIHAAFETPNRIGIIGNNGSGKSTLLKLLTAAEQATSGTINYWIDAKNQVANEAIYKHISFTAPYIDLPEDLTTLEIISFYKKFKVIADSKSVEVFLEEINLTEAKNKLVKHFSSGMKQRLKLGLAIACDSTILLLDEPCANLDKHGIEIYHRLLDTYAIDKLCIISSNEDKNELYKINQRLDIHDFKK